MKLNLDKAENLNLEFTCECENQLDSLSEFQHMEQFNVPPHQPIPETADAPASSHFDAKSAGIAGILTLLLSSPVIIQIIQGVPMTEVINTFIGLIRENFWALALLALLYMFREMIHSAFKQFILAKIIDTKADPNKNSVEVKPQ